MDRKLTFRNGMTRSSLYGLVAPEEISGRRELNCICQLSHVSPHFFHAKTSFGLLSDTQHGCLVASDTMITVATDLRTNRHLQLASPNVNDHRANSAATASRTSASVIGRLEYIRECSIGPASLPSRVINFLSCNVVAQIFSLFDHLVCSGEQSRMDAVAERSAAGSLTTAKARRLSPHSIAGVAGAVLVNAPTFGGGYLIQGKAGAISCTTDIYTLVFGGLSRREGERGEIGVARIECSRTR
jgi:hypothetical protein